MFIRMEETPNPDTLKFVPEKDFEASKTTVFNSIRDCDNTPFIKDLLGIEELESVLLDKKFLSVTKKSSVSWDSLKAIISAKISDFINSGEKLIIEEEETQINSKDENPVEHKIKELLNDKVKPVVASHGGDITFHSYEKGRVYLELKGSCSGCPSSTATLKMGIENMLKHYIPEIKEVLDVSSNQ